MYCVSAGRAQWSDCLHQLCRVKLISCWWPVPFNRISNSTLPWNSTSQYPQLIMYILFPALRFTQPYLHWFLGVNFLNGSVTRLETALRAILFHFSNSVSATSQPVRNLILGDSLKLAALFLASTSASSFVQDTGQQLCSPLPQVS